MSRRRFLSVVNAKSVVKDYLRMDFTTSGTIVLTVGKNIDTDRVKSISYSKDLGKTWTTWTNSGVRNANTNAINLNVAEGDVLLFKGDNNALGKDANGSYTMSKFSGTASFNLSGHIMSLLTEDFENATFGNYEFIFISLFSGAKVIDASGLILPSSNYARCYYRMFRSCTSLTTSPVLVASNNNPKECYRGLFYGCSSLNYITAFYTTNTSNSEWVNGVAAEGVFVKHIDATWSNVGIYGTPEGWTIIYYDPTTNKYYLSDKTTECDDHGNVIS